MERFLDQADKGATAPSDSRPTPVLEHVSVPLGHLPGASASSSSSRPPSYLPTPRPPTVSAPSVPKDSTPTPREDASSEPGRGTLRSNVRSGAIRIDIQHDYEAGVEVRLLLSTEQLEEADNRLAVTDVDPHSGTRFVRFWIDEIPLDNGNPGDERQSHVPTASRDTLVIPERRERGSPLLV